MTNGQRPLSPLSLYVASTWCHLPLGWSICGWLGLIALVMPVFQPVTTAIDTLVGEKDHCYVAMLRSIERAGHA